MGFLWFTCILLYGIGSPMLGHAGSVYGWAINAGASILISCTWGFVMGEWINATWRAKRLLANKVDTKGLPKLTVLTINDCRVMREAYGRCSALLHSTSEALNKPLPAPDVIEVEIRALSKWVTDIQDRQDKIAPDS